MRIEVLTAEAIRNLRPLTLAPRERFNVFVGDNGQGKTNLLEAIYAVATLRSFRTAKLSDLVAFGAPEARVGARVLKDDLTRVYEVAIAPGSRRVTLDGKAARPLARYFGGFNVVVFTPEDLGIPRGSPGDRRRFLDRAVFNLRPEYLANVQDYEKVIKQRNTVLKMAGQGSLLPPRVDELLAVYDAQLAPLALAVANARAEMVERVNSELSPAFSAITRTGFPARARYVSKIAGSSTESIATMLRDARMKDLATCATQTGPHSLRRGSCARSCSRGRAPSSRCWRARMAINRFFSSTMCRASSILRAISTCSSTSRRGLGSASSRRPMAAMSCSTATGPITAFETVRFPREIRQLIPFASPLDVVSHHLDGKTALNG
jgi:RecF protein